MYSYVHYSTSNEVVLKRNEPIFSCDLNIYDPFSLSTINISRNSNRN